MSGGDRTLGAALANGLGLYARTFSRALSELREQDGISEQDALTEARNVAMMAVLTWDQPMPDVSAGRAGPDGGAWPFGGGGTA